MSIFICILAGLCLSNCPLSAEELVYTDWFWDATHAPRLPVPILKKAPNIDGRLVDTCWENASRVTGTFASDGLKHGPAISVYWGRDGKHLYAGVIVPPKEIDSFKAPDDKTGLSFLIQAGGRNAPVFLYGIRRSGKLFHYRMPGPRGYIEDHKTAAEIKTSVENKAWSAEFRIPFEELGTTPKEGDVWRLNFIAGAILADKSGFFNWSGTISHRNSLKPRHAGELLFQNLAVRCGEERPPVGQGELSFTIRNPADRTLRLSSTTLTRTEAGSIVRDPGKTLDIAAGEIGSISISYATRAEGLQHISFLLLEGEEIVACRREVFFIPQPAGPEIEWLLNACDERLRAPPSSVYGRKLFPAGKGVRTTLEGIRSDYDRLKKQSKEKELMHLLKRHSYAVWHRSPWTPTLPTDLPPKLGASAVPSLNIEAAQNEHEHEGFLLTNLGSRPMTFQVRASVKSSMRGVRFELRADPAVPTHVMHGKNPRTLGLRPNDYNADDYSGVPLPLLGEMGLITIMPMRTRQVWLTIDTQDMNPGSYSGTLSIGVVDRAGFPTRTIPVKLRVYPVKLSDRAPFPTYLWDYASGDETLQDMVEHKVNVFLVSSTNFLPKIKPDGSVSYDFQLGQLREKFRFGKIMISYGFCESFWRWAESKNIDSQSERFSRILTDNIKAMIKAFKSEGLSYDDFWMQTWDECKRDEVPKMLHTTRIIRNADPKIRLVMDPDLDVPTMQKLAPLTDVWIPQIEAMERDDPEAWVAFFDEEKKKGKPVWCYQCSTPVLAQRPLSYWRFQGWRAWKYGFGGVAFFAHAYMTYPANGKRITTRAYEAFRDGVEDLQLIRQVENIAKQGGNDSYTPAQIEKAVKALATARKEMLPHGYRGMPTAQLAEMLGKHRTALLDAASKKQGPSP